tara:strand:- start:553 stop:1287 length:735 start_codon:yes stop_codon:yes gene_type:complete
MIDNIDCVKKLNLERKFLIRTKNLSHKIKTKVILSNLNFQIFQKGICCIMGPNGAGKSILLKIISGLIAPTSGLLSVNKDCKTFYVSQRTIFLRRSVYQNLVYPLKINNIFSRTVHEKIINFLEISNLMKFKNQSARKLSIGQQQLLAVIRGLIIEPNILLLDEPCSNLDPKSANVIEQIIKNSSKSGIKIILVTHDLLQTKRLADDIIFLHNGKIIEHSNKSFFFNKSNSRQVKNYLNGKLLK